MECNKAFKCITNTHLNRHSITMEEYIIKYPKAILRDANVIKTMYSGHSKRMSELRCNGIIKTTPMGKQARIEASRRMKQDNPMKNKETAKKMVKTKSERTYIIKRTPEQRKRYSESKMGDKNPMKRPEVAMKSAIGHTRKKSGCEIKFDRIVDEYALPLKYVGNNKLWIGYKNPDYVDTEDKKLVIEVTSDAYNRVEEKYEEKRIEHFKKYNYRCITIRYTKCQKASEDKLHHNIGKLLKKIIYENSRYQIYHSFEGETKCIQH